MAHFEERGEDIEAWISENVPRKQWHDGHVWKKGAEAGEMHWMVETMRSVPVVLVGPQRLEGLVDWGVNITRHIVAHPREAIEQRRTLTREVKNAPGNALYAFSLGGLSNILIRELWPSKRFLVNFGAVWDGLLGYPVRLYQRDMSDELVRQNIYGSGH